MIQLTNEDLLLHCTLAHKLLTHAGVLNMALQSWNLWAAEGQHMSAMTV